MMKQPDASGGHRYLVFVARGDDFSITIRSAGLHDPTHATLHRPIN
jgi:hypothetical protein